VAVTPSDGRDRHDPSLWAETLLGFSDPRKTRGYSWDTEQGKAAADAPSWRTWIGIWHELCLGSTRVMDQPDGFKTVLWRLSDMEYIDLLKTISVFGPILGLLVVGFLVSSQSGVACLTTPQGFRLFLGNLSRVLIRVFGYLAGLLAVQQFVGFPTGLTW
jgi:hypothetical protein